MLAGVSWVDGTCCPCVRLGKTKQKDQYHPYNTGNIVIQYRDDVLRTGVENNRPVMPCAYTREVGAVPSRVDNEMRGDSTKKQATLIPKM